MLYPACLLCPFLFIDNSANNLISIFAVILDFSVIAGSIFDVMIVRIKSRLWEKLLEEPLKTGMSNYVSVIHIQRHNLQQIVFSLFRLQRSILVQEQLLHNFPDTLPPAVPDPLQVLSG